MGLLKRLFSPNAGPIAANRGSLPIEAFCNQQRLTEGERLLLFDDVCRLVEARHAYGHYCEDLAVANIDVSLDEGAWSVHIAGTTHCPERLDPEFENRVRASGVIAAAELCQAADVWRLGQVLLGILQADRVSARVRILLRICACRQSMRSMTIASLRDLVAKCLRGGGGGESAARSLRWTPACSSNAAPSRG